MKRIPFYMIATESKDTEMCIVKRTMVMGTLNPWNSMDW